MARPKDKELATRYEFNQSSLKLLEELQSQLSEIDDQKTRYEYFLNALDIAPVGLAFFSSFLDDENFVAYLASQSPDPAASHRLFTLNYRAACLTCCSPLWENTISLGLSPQIDFTFEELSCLPIFGGSPTVERGLPILFPAADLYLGLIDFGTSLTLAMLALNRWNSGTSGELWGGEEIGVLVQGGLQISPMTHLLVSAIALAGQHPTQSGQLWSLVRGSVSDSLKELLDKWQAGLVAEPRRPRRGTAESEASDSSADLGGALSDDMQPESPSEMSAESTDDLLWNIWCESWRLRCLFFRELSLPSVRAATIRDEYSLFEYELPEAFRVLKVPNLSSGSPDVLTDIEQIRKAVVAEIRDRCRTTTTTAGGSVVGRRRVSKGSDDIEEEDRQPYMLAAQALSEVGDKSWPFRRALEGQLAGGEDDEEEEVVSLLTPNLTTGSDDWFLGSSALNSGVARRKETRCALWAEYIAQTEKEIRKLQQTLLASRAARSQRRRVNADEMKSNEGDLMDETIQDSGDILGLVEQLLRHPVRRLLQQKRGLVNVFVRALEDVGDIRLDFFEAFWDMIQRESDGDEESYRWLDYWRLWITETSCRRQPNKGCCWLRYFQLVKQWADHDFEDHQSFVRYFTTEGPFHKFLVGPNWWKIAEVVPTDHTRDDYDAGRSDEVGKREEGRRDELPRRDEAARGEDAGREYEDLNRRDEGDPLQDEVGRITVASQEVLDAHTSDFLACVCEGVKVSEAVFRLFFAESAETTAEVLCDSSLSILQKAEDRVLMCREYLKSEVLGESGDRDRENLAALDLSLVTSMLVMKVLKGIVVLRHHQDVLPAICDEIDDLLSTAPGRSHSVQDQLRVLRHNLHISLYFCKVILADHRYFPNLKGTWLSALLVKGDLSGLSVSRHFLQETFDVAFEQAIAKLSQNDPLPNFGLNPRPVSTPGAQVSASAPPSQATTKVSSKETGSQHSRQAIEDSMFQLAMKLYDALGAFPESHPFHQLSSLVLDRLTANRGETCSERSRIVHFYPTNTLPPPTATFPALGTPIKIELSDLSADKPFSLTRHRSTSSLTGGHAARSSSSTSSDSMAWATHGRQLSSPMQRSVELTPPPRRLSCEDIERLTRATFDGHEATLPELTPNVPPPLLHSEALLPGIRHHREHHELDPTGRACHEHPGTEAKRPRLEEFDPRVQQGKHFLQKRIVTGEVEVEELLGAPIEWDTLYVSNLPPALTDTSLRHEVESALQCNGLVELRMPRDKKLNKGFAYLQFDSAESAEKARAKIDQWKVDGRELKARISAPSKAIYEEKTVFISNLPLSISENKILTLLREKGPVSLEAQRKRGGSTFQTSSKRFAEEADPNQPPTSRVPDVGEEDTAEGRSERMETEKSNEAGQPLVITRGWAVKEVRIPRNQNGVPKRHGYIEFEDRRSCAAFLKWTQTHPEELAIDGEKIIAAPSIPIKEKRNVTQHVRAWKADLKSENENLGKMARTLHVTNLPFTAAQRSLKRLFAPFGDIHEVHLPKDPDRPGRNRGFAYIEFVNPMDATMAASSLNGMEFLSREIRVSPSTRVITVPKTEESPKEKTLVKPAKAKPRLVISATPTTTDAPTTDNHSEASATGARPTTNKEFAQFLCQ